MGQSNIAWTDETKNPAGGCKKCSPGCLNCYAETTAASSRLQQFDRYQKIITNGKFNGEIFFHQETLDKIVRQLNPQSMFMCSMCDLFYEERPFEDIDKICAVMELCQHLTFQILTKRAERMFEYYTSDRDIRSEGINDGIEHYTGGHLASEVRIADFGGILEPVGAAVVERHGAMNLEDRLARGIAEALQRGGERIGELFKSLALFFG